MRDAYRVWYAERVAADGPVSEGEGPPLPIETFTYTDADVLQDVAKLVLHTAQHGNTKSSAGNLGHFSAVLNFFVPSMLFVDTDEKHSPADFLGGAGSVDDEEGDAAGNADDSDGEGEAEPAAAADAAEKAPAGTDGDAGTEAAVKEEPMDAAAAQPAAGWPKQRTSIVSGPRMQPGPEPPAAGGSVRSPRFATLLMRSVSFRRVLYHRRGRDQARALFSCVACDETYASLSCGDEDE